MYGLHYSTEARGRHLHSAPDVRNNKVGVAGGDYGLLMFTSDGGQNWRRHTSLGERMNFIKAAFTEEHLILVGEHSIYLLDLRSLSL
jgi:photosystem II stability/assembly factor-like uncharacterized protein